jgi:hypothetical protein
MSHNSKYYVKKLTKLDGSKSMRLDQFGFKKKFLMNNASNCNESTESERAQSSQNADQDSDSEYQSQTVVNSLAPVDWRLFNSKKYEVLYPWLYFSGNKNGYLCKYCELFNPSSTLKCIGEGVKLR